jgi:hypothetical protein
MANLPAYRGVFGALQRTNEFKRLIQMMEQEPHDLQRMSAIEEFRKVILVGRLRATLTPETRDNTSGYRKKDLEKVLGGEPNKPERD